MEHGSVERREGGCVGVPERTKPAEVGARKATLGLEGRGVQKRDRRRNFSDSPRGGFRELGQERNRLDSTAKEERSARENVAINEKSLKRS